MVWKMLIMIFWWLHNIGARRRKESSLSSFRATQKYWQWYNSFIFAIYSNYFWPLRGGLVVEGVTCPDNLRSCLIKKIKCKGLQPFMYMNFVIILLYCMNLDPCQNTHMLSFYFLFVTFPWQFSHLEAELEADDAYVA